MKHFLSNHVIKIFDVMDSLGIKKVGINFEC